MFIFKLFAPGQKIDSNFQCEQIRIFFFIKINVSERRIVWKEVKLNIDHHLHYINTISKWNEEKRNNEYQYWKSEKKAKKKLNRIPLPENCNDAEAAHHNG